MGSEGVGDPAPKRETTAPPSERAEQLEDEVAELEARTEELQVQVAELETQIEERTNALAKVQADYENYRKRVDQEKQEARREAHAELVEVLAGVMDDVDRALQADPSDNVRKGLELVTKRVESQLEALDVQRIEPEPGEPFDPSRHEALLTETTSEHEPDTVIELLQPGYALDGRIVRAARVKVAKAPATSET